MSLKRSGKFRNVSQKPQYSESSSEDSGSRRNRKATKRKRDKKVSGKVESVGGGGYEGDSEPTCDSSVPSDSKMSMDEYEFNEPDSPSTAGGRIRKNPKSSHKNTSKPARKRTGSHKSRDVKHKRMSEESSNEENTDTNESGIEISFRCVTDSGRGVKITQHPIAKSTPAYKRLACDLKDSGVPPQPFKVARFTSTETSTPGPFARSSSKMFLDDCFGFNSPQSPAAMPSPVRRVITPMSDYGSITPSGFDSTSQKSQSSLKSGQFEPKADFVLSDEKTKKEKKPRRNYKQWIKEKSTEFSEIENFELCIE